MADCRHANEECDERPIATRIERGALHLMDEGPHTRSGRQHLFLEKRAIFARGDVHGACSCSLTAVFCWYHMAGVCCQCPARRSVSPPGHRAQHGACACGSNSLFSVSVLQRDATRSRRSPRLFSVLCVCRGYDLGSQNQLFVEMIPSVNLNRKRASL